MDADALAALDAVALKKNAKRFAQRLGAELTLSAAGADVVVFHNGSLAMLENLTAGPDSRGPSAARGGRGPSPAVAKRAAVVTPEWLSQCAKSNARLDTAPFSIQLVYDTDDASGAVATTSTNSRGTIGSSNNGNKIPAPPTSSEALLSESARDSLRAERLAKEQKAAAQREARHALLAADPSSRFEALAEAVRENSGAASQKRRAGAKAGRSEEEGGGGGGTQPLSQSLSQKEKKKVGDAKTDDLDKGKGVAVTPKKRTSAAAAETPKVVTPKTNLLEMPPMVHQVSSGALAPATLASSDATNDALAPRTTLLTSSDSSFIGGTAVGGGAGVQQQQQQPAAVPTIVPSAPIVGEGPGSDPFQRPSPRAKGKTPPKYVNNLAGVYEGVQQFVAAAAAASATATAVTGANGGAEVTTALQNNNSGGGSASLPMGVASTSTQPFDHQRSANEAATKAPLHVAGRFPAPPPLPQTRAEALAPCDLLERERSGTVASPMFSSLSMTMSSYSHSAGVSGGGTFSIAPDENATTLFVGDATATDNTNSSAAAAAVAAAAASSAFAPSPGSCPFLGGHDDSQPEALDLAASAVAIASSVASPPSDFGSKDSLKLAGLQLAQQQHTATMDVVNGSANNAPQTLASDAGSSIITGSAATSSALFAPTAVSAAAVAVPTSSFNTSSAAASQQRRAAAAAERLVSTIHLASAALIDAKTSTPRMLGSSMAEEVTSSSQQSNSVAKASPSAAQCEAAPPMSALSQQHERHVKLSEILGCTSALFGGSSLGGSQPSSSQQQQHEQEATQYEHQIGNTSLPLCFGASSQHASDDAAAPINPQQQQQVADVPPTAVAVENDGDDGSQLLAKFPSLTLLFSQPNPFEASAGDGGMNGDNYYGSDDAYGGELNATQRTVQLDAPLTLGSTQTSPYALRGNSMVSQQPQHPMMHALAPDEKGILARQLSHFGYQSPYAATTAASHPPLMTQRIVTRRAAAEAEAARENRDAAEAAALREAALPASSPRRKITIADEEPMVMPTQALRRMSPSKANRRAAKELAGNMKGGVSEAEWQAAADGGDENANALTQQTAATLSAPTACGDSSSSRRSNTASVASTAAGLSSSEASDAYVPATQSLGTLLNSAHNMKGEGSKEGRADNDDRTIDTNTLLPPRGTAAGRKRFRNVTPPASSSSSSSSSASSDGSDADVIDEIAALLSGSSASLAGSAASSTNSSAKQTKATPAKKKGAASDAGVASPQPQPTSETSTIGGQAKEVEQQPQPQRSADPQPTLVSLSGNGASKDLLADIFAGMGVTVETRVFGRNNKPSHVVLLDDVAGGGGATARHSASPSSSHAAGTSNFEPLKHLSGTKSGVGVPGAHQPKVTPKVLFALASGTPLLRSAWGLSGMDLKKFPSYIFVPPAALPGGNARSLLLSATASEPDTSATLFAFVPPVAEASEYVHPLQRPLAELYGAFCAENVSLRGALAAAGAAVPAYSRRAVGPDGLPATTGSTASDSAAIGCPLGAAASCGVLTGVSGCPTNASLGTGGDLSEGARVPPIALPNQRDFGRRVRAVRDSLLRTLDQHSASTAAPEATNAGGHSPLGGASSAASLPPRSYAILVHQLAAALGIPTGAATPFSPDPFATSGSASPSASVGRANRSPTASPAQQQRDAAGSSKHKKDESGAARPVAQQLFSDRDDDDNAAPFSSSQRHGEEDLPTIVRRRLAALPLPALLPVVYATASLASNPFAAAAAHKKEEELFSPIDHAVKFMAIAHKEFGHLSRRVFEAMGERGELPGVDPSSPSGGASSSGTRGRRRVERSVVGAAEPSLTPSAVGGDAATPHGQQQHQQQNNVLAALQQSASPAACLARSSGLTEKLYGALRRHYLASILDGLRFYILGTAPAAPTNAQLGELVKHLGGTVVRTMTADPLTIVLEVDGGVELAQMAAKLAKSADDDENGDGNNVVDNTAPATAAKGGAKGGKAPAAKKGRASAANKNGAATPQRSPDQSPSPLERRAFFSAFPFCDFLVSHRWLIDVVIEQRLLDFRLPQYLVAARGLKKQELQQTVSPVVEGVAAVGIAGDDDNAKVSTTIGTTAENETLVSATPSGGANSHQLSRASLGVAAAFGTPTASSNNGGSASRVTGPPRRAVSGSVVAASAMPSVAASPVSDASPLQHNRGSSAIGSSPMPIPLPPFPTTIVSGTAAAPLKASVPNLHSIVPAGGSSSLGRLAVQSSAEGTASTLLAPPSLPNAASPPAPVPLPRSAVGSANGGTFVAPSASPHRAVIVPATIDEGVGDVAADVHVVAEIEEDGIDHVEEARRSDASFSSSSESDDDSASNSDDANVGEHGDKDNGDDNAYDAEGDDDGDTSSSDDSASDSGNAFIGPLLGDAGVAVAPLTTPKTASQSAAVWAATTRPAAPPQLFEEPPFSSSASSAAVSNSTSPQRPADAPLRHGMTNAQSSGQQRKAFAVSTSPTGASLHGSGSRKVRRTGQPSTSASHYGQQRPPSAAAVGAHNPSRALGYTESSGALGGAAAGRSAVGVKEPRLQYNTQQLAADEGSLAGYSSFALSSASAASQQSHHQQQQQHRHQQQSQGGARQAGGGGPQYDFSRSTQQQH